MENDVIQSEHGTGWEADDRKGLGDHRHYAVVFYVLATPKSFFQKIEKSSF
jgi:hypothetical protein